MSVQRELDSYAARQGWLRTRLRSLARGAVLSLLDRPVATPVRTPARNILVVRWDGKLGDAVVSSFLYREAKRSGARVCAITTNNLVELHRKQFGVDSVVGVSPRPGILQLVRLAWRMRGRVDTVVHLTERLAAREIVFLWLLHPLNVFSLDEHPRWVNGRLGIESATLRFEQKYAAVLRLLGISVSDTSPVIPAMGEGAKVDVDIVFNPFGSRPDKSISVPRAILTLRELTRMYPELRIGVLNCARTRTQAEDVCAGVGSENVAVCQGSETIPGMIDTLWAASVVISVDTSVVHIAAGMRKSLVAIYPLFTSQANPWLPPESTCTSVIFSPVDPVSYAATGLKCLDNYRDEELLEALGMVGVVAFR